MVGQQFVSRLARHPWFNLTGWRPASARKGRPTRPPRRGGWRRRCPTTSREPHRRGAACPAAARRSCSRRSTPRSPARSKAPSPPPATSSSATRATTAWIRWCRCSFPRSTPITWRCSPSSARQGLDGRHRHQPELLDASCWRWRWRRCARSASARVVVTTMQAVSGAGYPGVPSLDILGNVVPFIGGEEEKIESETLKILGADGGRAPHPVRDQRAHQPRAGHRRPHDDGLGRARADARRRRGRRRRCARSAAGRRSCGLPTAPEPGHRGDERSRTARSRGSTPISAAA